MRQQGIMDGIQLMGRFADPEGQGGTININALTRIDLALAIQRQVSGIL